MPVMGSRRPLSWEMDQDGVTRRSDDEFSDLIRRGRSAAVFITAVFGVCSWKNLLVAPVFSEEC